MFNKLKNLFSSDKLTQLDPENSETIAGIRPQNAVSELSRADILSRWSSLQRDGRRIDVYTPALPETPRSAVLFLHGHGQVMLDQNERFSRLLLEHNMVGICPDGARSWWLDVISPEFDEHITPQGWLLDSVVPFIEQQFSIVPPRIALCGVSMGGQGALQLAFRHASRFPVVAAISPAVDFHQMYGHGLPLDQMFPDVETARQNTVVLNLHPLAWPRHQFFCCDPADQEWFDGCARLGMKLSSSGILHERDLETSAGGHTWDYFNHMADRVFEHIAKGLTAYDS